MYVCMHVCIMYVWYLIHKHVLFMHGTVQYEHIIHVCMDVEILTESVYLT